MNDTESILTDTKRIIMNIFQQCKSMIDDEINDTDWQQLLTEYLDSSQVIGNFYDDLVIH